MQTKRKRKQWALLAFTMIATFVLQIITPLTANAEERTYTYSNFSTTEVKEIMDYTYSDDVHISYIINRTVTANKPIKIGILERSVLDDYYRDGYCEFYVFCDDITDIKLTYFNSFSDFCEPCKYPNTHTDEMKIYDSSNFNELHNSNGEFVGYYMKLSAIYHSIYDYYGNADKDKIKYQHIEYNNSLITYFVNYGMNEEANDCVLRSEDYDRFLTEVADGTIPPMGGGQFDESTAIYDTNIPTPNITVKNDYTFGFNNDSDGYYFQVKGRWYSVDDIELYKEKLQWCYKYESIIKSNLTDWVTTNEKASTAMQDLNFATFGKTAFDSFLSYYPIENRSYSGGTNTLGNFFNGYNDALSQIKMLLSQPTTLYNGIEIYIRYYTFDENGVAHYGKWCHYYDDLANQDGSNGVIDDYIHNDDKDLHNGYQSEFGVDDDKLLELESSNNSKNDIDLKPEEDNRYTDQIVSVDDLDLSNLINSLGGLKEQGSELINMFTTVFSFLPSWLVTLIVCSFGLCCVIGVWKVIRG